MPATSVKRDGKLNGGFRIRTQIAALHVAKATHLILAIEKTFAFARKSTYSSTRDLPLLPNSQAIDFMGNYDPEAVFEGHRDRFIKILEPLFLPDDPVSNDIIRYFASLLRVLGMEDKGWDPHAESRNILNDLNRLMKLELPEDRFPDNRTLWRLGLLLYSHIVEMDAPYEVIMNLLRFRLGKGYSPNPYFDFLTAKEQKNFSKNGIRTGRKIELIKQLSKEAGLAVGNSTTSSIITDCGTRFSIRISS